MPDQDKAKRYLSYIGYYRIAGYARHLRDHQGADAENYVAGTSFDQVLDLYMFDRKLRLLVFDAIERIEVSVRAVLSNVGGQADGPFWISNANNFDYGLHGRIIDEIKVAIGPDPEENAHLFIQHFYRKYSDPYPPSWMLMECMSLGATSRIYKHMKGTLRQQVSAVYGLQHDILESWLHSMAFARNVCAHHSRFWRRTFTIRPKIPKAYNALVPEASSNRAYGICVMLHHMMRVIADESEWAVRLRQQVNSSNHVEPADMGFPPDWETQPFWEFPPAE